MALSYWNDSCTAFTTSEFKAHKKELEESYVENGCQKTLAVDEYARCLASQAKCDPLASAIITEDYPLEHKSNEVTFYYKVFPFLVYYPPSFEAALPNEYKWAQVFTLVELVGKMAMKGTRFKTFGNVNLETGRVIFRNHVLTPIEEANFKQLGLLDNFNVAKFVNCLHSKRDEEDCSECFVANGGVTDANFQTEQIYRRDVRNCCALHDFQGLKYLLGF